MTAQWAWRTTLSETLPIISARLIPPRPLLPTAAHRYQSCLYVLGQGDDLLRRPSQPEVCACATLP